VGLNAGTVIGGPAQPGNAGCCRQRANIIKQGKQTELKPAPTFIPANRMQSLQFEGTGTTAKITDHAAPAGPIPRPASRTLTITRRELRNKAWSWR